MSLPDSDLTPPEQELGRALTAGTVVDLQTHDPATDDPRHGAQWGPDRTIRADVLAELLTQAPGAQWPRALRLVGARITGTLDLADVDIPYPVMLLACRFDEPLNLLNATICSLWLPDCHLPEIVLMGTRIGGQLNLTNATLSNPGGIALNGDGLTVGQHLVCRKLKAEGTLLFRTAHIGGQLSLTDAALSNPKGSALHGNRLPTVAHHGRPSPAPHRPTRARDGG
jgi:hypothetical protein